MFSDSWSKKLLRAGTGNRQARPDFPAQMDELSEIKDVGKEQKRTNIPKRETEVWGYQIFWTMDVSRR